MYSPFLSLIFIFLMLGSALGFSSISWSSTLNTLDGYIVTVKSGSNLSRHLAEVQSWTPGFPNSTTDTKKRSFVSHQYSIGDFQGYAGRFDPFTIQKLHAHHEVLNIERDLVSSIKSPTERRKRSIVTQRTSSYGLQQISQRASGSPDQKYFYDSSAGSQTFAYLLDTGIFAEHLEFQGRASFGYDATKTCRCTPSCPGACKDRDGHGTHVAGIVGSRTWGVAKRCSMIAVKVGTRDSVQLSKLLDVLQWAVDEIEERSRQSRAVIAITVTVPYSAALNGAVSAAYRRGVSTVTAAGNDNHDAKQSSPGSSQAAITVAASDVQRHRASFSNWGPAVDLFAPGVGIYSTWIGDRAATRAQSGTSQACAYVAGVVLYLKGLHDLRDASTTRDRLLALATRGVVRNTGNTANVFVYNGSGR
ncbi:hypothetical protein ANO11243_071050 [Dothideomycetidae sp. 11243]|nr:hypothetical protein ANO11243_071050 [fungal sp. No.11243]